MQTCGLLLKTWCLNDPQRNFATEWHWRQFIRLKAASSRATQDHMLLFHICSRTPQDLQTHISVSSIHQFIIIIIIIIIIIQWETIQAIAKYLEYLQTQFDPRSESSSDTQKNLRKSIRGIRLQKMKYQPWLTLQSRQLWHSIDTQAKTHTARPSRGIAYLVSSHWDYLLCFSCNLPTSLSAVLWCVDTNTTVITRTYTPVAATSSKTLLYWGKEWKPEGASTRSLPKRAEKKCQTLTNRHHRTTGRMKGEVSCNYDKHQTTASEVSKRRFRKPRFVKVIFIDSKITYIHCESEYNS